MKKTLLLCMLMTTALCLQAQQPYFLSVHQEESEYYKALGRDHYQMDEEEYQAVASARAKTMRAGCTPDKVIFGYHPYWNADTVCLDYRWELLTDLCFFSYEVDTLTGNALSTHGWTTSRAVDSALANGVRVHLCVTLFDGHAYFFNNASARQTLITNLINLVQARGAHGVNIDFESVPSSQKTNLTAFLIDLCNQMHTAIPGSLVSIASPAVNWNGTFEIASLNNYLDWFVIMGYDYYWSGSTSSGPLSGLYSMTCGTTDNLSRTLTYYLSNGASKEKVVLALPYYGRQWKTTGSAVPSPTIAGTSTSRTYRTIRMNSSGYYIPANRGWEPNSLTPYYVFHDGTNWNQCFADNEKSLAYRYDMVRLRDVAGIGIWALGYDDDYPELWNLLEEKLTDCRVVPCSDTLYDLGGPGCNHFDNEDFTWTLAPDNATGLSMTFSSFSLESGWDSLWIYDGPSIASPLIGGYSGTAGPGTVNASGGALTLRYHSDNATTRPGWMAIWNCTSDNILPETFVSANTWETGNFTALFTDTDNLGIDERYYQVLDFDGTEWRAQPAAGFFNDQFTTTIHPEWTADSGVWSVNAAHLLQSDPLNENTNIFAMLSQDDQSAWLYHWQMNIGGSGPNRRAGLHFFCDDPSGENRGNSYFVYYRADDDKVQIYRCTNDVFSLKTNIACAIDPNTWYDCKLTYDPLSGVVRAYLNNELITQWTDPSPLGSGNSVSLRSGGCSVMYDDVKVYRSRGISETVSVGPGAEVRYQNPDPFTPSCSIRSLVTDQVGWWSNTGSIDINIDWTPPDSGLILNDGNAADLDTSALTHLYEANWTQADDPHSGVLAYHFALGSSPGDSNVIGWTGLGLVLSYSQGALSLIPGQWYFASVRAVNGAGLVSAPWHSDGIFIETATAVGGENPVITGVFPNPFNDRLTLELMLEQGSRMEFRFLDMEGRILWKEERQLAGGFHRLSLHPGVVLKADAVYVLQILDEGKPAAGIRLLKASDKNR